LANEGSAPGIEILRSAGRAAGLRMTGRQFKAENSKNERRVILKRQPRLTSEGSALGIDILRLARQAAGLRMTGRQFKAESLKNKGASS